MQIRWNLVWDTFGMLPKSEVGFNKLTQATDDIITWYWFGNEIRMSSSWLSFSILMKLWQQNYWYDS